MRIALTAAAILFFVPLAAAMEPADEPALTNETCPVMLGEKVDPDLFVTYKGKRVYLCCESCVTDFEASPETYLEHLPQFATASVAAASGTSGQKALSPREKHPLGGLHPMLVHFPVALTMVAFLAWVLSFFLAGNFLRTFATLTILIAATFSVPAYLLGEEAEEALGKMSEQRHETVEAHEEIGTIAMYALLGAAVLGLIVRAKPDVFALRVAMLLVLLAAAGLVGYTGYLGAEVVRPGHLNGLF